MNRALDNQLSQLLAYNGFRPQKHNSCAEFPPCDTLHIPSHIEKAEPTSMLPLSFVTW